MTDQWYDLLMANSGKNEKSFMVEEGEILGVPKGTEAESALLKNWDPRSWLKPIEESDDVPPKDFLPIIEDWPVVSPKVRAAMETSGIGVKDVQFLPIRVLDMRGDEIPGFSILNILPRIEALHREQTLYLKTKPEDDPMTGKPRVFNLLRPAAYCRALEGHDIVRRLDFPSLILCSARFRKMWREHKFTGASLENVVCVDEPVPEGFQKKVLTPAVIGPLNL